MNNSSDCRQIAGKALVTALRTARQLTIAATSDLSDKEWRVPYHPGIQPVAWDLAHIGWFAEFWMLRGRHCINRDGNIDADVAARHVEHDDRYDSARISHRFRWEMPLYERDELYARLESQLQACIEAVEQSGDSDDELYFARLVLYHEDMHHEALLWTRDLLGYRAPEGYSMPCVEARKPIHCAGGKIALGRSAKTPGFTFDNETPSCKVTVAPFSIDATPVTNARFLEFVTAKGYERAEFWPGTAGEFQKRAGRNHPERWRQTSDGAYEARSFDEWRPIVAD
jgi:iron(II)-dependent oxidoreductase